MEILNGSDAGAIGKLWGPAVENMSHIKLQVVATRNNFYYTYIILWFCSLLCFVDWVDESISHSRKNINYNQLKFYEITDFKHCSGTFVIRIRVFKTITTLVLSSCRICWLFNNFQFKLIYSLHSQILYIFCLRTCCIGMRSAFKNTYLSMFKSKCSCTVTAVMV